MPVIIAEKKGRENIDILFFQLCVWFSPKNRDQLLHKTQEFFRSISFPIKEAPLLLKENMTSRYYRISVTTLDLRVILTSCGLNSIVV